MLSSFAFFATNCHSVDDASIGLFRARLAPAGGWGFPGPGSVPPAVPRTSSSQSCPAGQPVFAVICTRT